MNPLAAQMPDAAPLHLFISKQGTLLPHWRAAFTKTVALHATDFDYLTMEPSVLWLRVGIDGVPAHSIKALRAGLPEVPLIMLCDAPNDELTLRLLEAGARGCCNSHAAIVVLQQLAAVVSQGGIWIGENLMQRLLRAAGNKPAQPINRSTAATQIDRQAAPDDWTVQLTLREAEVAQEVAKGANNREIAEALGITERTVKAHIGAALEKLQLRDRLQLSLLINRSAALANQLTSKS